MSTLSEQFEHIRRNVRPEKQREAMLLTVLQNNATADIAYRRAAHAGLVKDGVYEEIIIALALRCQEVEQQTIRAMKNFPCPCELVPGASPVAWAVKFDDGIDYGMVCSDKETCEDIAAGHANSKVVPLFERA
jgi:hypothetical protein